MEYSRMIHDYLDGELDLVNQDILFAQLALNQDLRTEFNQQVKLQVVTQSDMATITPPFEATNAIFASLGFSIPSQEYLKNLSANTVAEGPLSAIKKFWSRHIALNSILLLLLLMTGSYVVFQPVLFKGSGNGNSQKGKNAIMSKTIDNNKFSAMSSSVPIISSFEKNISQTNVNNDKIASNNSASNNVNYNRNGRSGRFYNNSSFIANEKNSGINNFASVQDVKNYNESSSDNGLWSFLSKAIQDLSMNEIAQRRMNSNLTYNSNAYVNPVQSHNSNYYIWGLTSYRYRPTSPEVSVDDTKWMVQIHTLYLNQSQQIDLSQSFDKPAPNNWYNNLSFSALYKFNPYHSLGLECGWEPFNQVFYNTKNGQTYKQQQSPTLFWIGAAYRLTNPDFGWENVIYPYAQIVGGGTSVGPIGRGRIGLQIEPISLIRFDVGFEAACLYYRLQGNNYFPVKYGFTFGGGINF
jgi:hypothetical protein